MPAVVFCMAFVLPGCGGSPKIQHPYAQAYVAGEGNIQGAVDAAAWAALDPAFVIGADAEGAAVFQDPEKAFSAFADKYADGIACIKAEFDLDKLTPESYAAYKTYGWQTAAGTETERAQAASVSEFLDIYENSF